jgi:hypothetical protein
MQESNAQPYLVKGEVRPHEQRHEHAAERVEGHRQPQQRLEVEHFHDAYTELQKHMRVGIDQQNRTSYDGRRYVTAEVRVWDQENPS